MYKKIDIFYDGEYVCSTCQAKSLADAKKNFIKNHTWVGAGVEKMTVKDDFGFATFKVFVRYAEEK